MTAAPRLVVVATSARALAAAARRAGFVPLALDVFGDQDTRALCAATSTPRRRGALRFSPARLLDAARALARDHAPLGFVYGAGLEHAPATLAALADVLPLFGASGETVRQVKSPQGFAAFCDAHGIARPQIDLAPPANPQDWLVKPRGGAGGLGVRCAAGVAASPRRYFQRRAEGKSLSALFAADGRAARILGWSEQWTDPAPHAPFRYGGAVGPAQPDPGAARAMLRAVDAAAAHFGLRGLCGADFLVADATATLLEINPRPGATLDVFDSPEDPLLRRHLEACRGDLGGAPRLGLPRASQVVYARSDCVTPQAMAWPDWAADRPAGGHMVKAQEPLCTVFAQAQTMDDARRLADERAARIVAMAGGAAT